MGGYILLIMVNVIMLFFEIQYASLLGGPFPGKKRFTI